MKTAQTRRKLFFILAATVLVVAAHGLFILKIAPSVESDLSGLSPGPVAKGRHSPVAERQLPADPSLGVQLETDDFFEEMTEDISEVHSADWTDEVQ